MEITINKKQHAKLVAGKSVRLQSNKLTSASVSLDRIIKVGQVIYANLSVATRNITTPVEVISITDTDFKIIHKNKEK